MKIWLLWRQLRLNEVIRVGSYSKMTGVLIRRGRDPEDKHAQRKDSERTKEEGRHMQAKE